jgi:hypothetical protein
MVVMGDSSVPAWEALLSIANPPENQGKMTLGPARHASFLWQWSAVGVMIAGNHEWGAADDVPENLYCGNSAAFR